jgi:hypothetical protein
MKFVVGGPAFPTVPGLLATGRCGNSTIIMITLWNEAEPPDRVIAASTSGWLGDGGMLRVIRQGVGQVALGGALISRAISTRQGRGRDRCFGGKA